MADENAGSADEPDAGRGYSVILAGDDPIALQDFTLADLDENDFVFYEARPDGG